MYLGGSFCSWLAIFISKVLISTLDIQSRLVQVLYNAQLNRIATGTEQAQEQDLGLNMSSISGELDVLKPSLRQTKPAEMATLKSLESRTAENPEQNVADLFETLEKQALKSISKLNTSVSSHEYISIYRSHTVTTSSYAYRTLLGENGVPHNSN